MELELHLHPGPHRQSERGWSHLPHVGTANYSFFTQLFHSQIQFWFPIILWIYPIFSLFSTTGCSFLAIRRDTVDVDLTFSAQVGKSWGTKMIEQRRVTDNRLADSLGLKHGLDKVSNLFCTPRSQKCQQKAAVAVLLPSDLMRGNCFYSVV